MNPTDFEIVIGLEVHVQLATDSKIFSSALARLGEGQSVADEIPNFNTTPVCAGHPGSLPVLNRKALDYAIRVGLATNCRVNTVHQFARKHYFYPDSPKGYQISQLEKPMAEHGYLDIEWGELGEQQKRIGITRIHMEEDAGKSVHAAGYSLVNLNRAGIPLIEVVSEPDLRSPEEAGAYLRKLYSIVTFLGVCDGNLQEGNFRCDANVSVRPKGSNALGTRTETKNVNSFRFVEKAIEYEAARQIRVILSGGRIIQETRLYDSQKNQTFTMRVKESAEDYRYFPDPDLPPIRLTQDAISKIQSQIPELPDAKRDRYLREYQLSKMEASTLTSDRDFCVFFEDTVNAIHPLTDGMAKTVSSLISGEVLRWLGETGLRIKETRLRVSQFVDLAVAIRDGSISVTSAKKLIEHLFREGPDPGRPDVPGLVGQLIDREGLRQVSDLSSLEPLIRQVLTANPKQVDEYRSGKEKVLGFLVGQVMKATGGKANPSLLNPIIVKLINQKE